METTSLNRVFSIPYQHLYSTDFAGNLTAVTGTPSGLTRFIGDRSNYMLQLFADSSLEQLTSQLASSSPIVFYGPSGTGKTALAMSILAGYSALDAAHLSVNKPIFLSAQDFDRRYRQALETDSIDEFRQRILSSGGIAIDNLHQLDKKITVQLEIARLIDAGQRNNLPMIFTMSENPVTSNNLLARLTSRLSSGLYLLVDTPGVAARTSIVKELVQQNDINLTDDAIELIVSRFNVVVPKLEHIFAQIVNGLKANSNYKVGQFVDAHFLKQSLAGELVDLNQLAKLVLKNVAKEFHVKVADLKSNSRKQSVVLARNVFVYLLRELVGCSFKLIGTHCGRRDHSTILHSYRKILACENATDNDSQAIWNSANKLKRRLIDLTTNQSSLLG